MIVYPLVLLHVLLTTGGYVGLIAANAYLLFLSRSREARVVRMGLTAWRHCSQIFGPCLLLGVFSGFGVASVTHTPLGSFWLVTTYILVVGALTVQAAVMIPWQLRSNPLLEAGALPRMTPVVIVLIVMPVIYTSILWLMISRPG